MSSTWRRQTIAHARFSESWVRGGSSVASGARQSSADSGRRFSLLQLHS